MATKKDNGTEAEEAPVDLDVGAMNIYERLAAITIEVGPVEHDKKASEKAGGFSFASFDLITDTLKPLCKKYKVFYHKTGMVREGEGNKTRLCGEVRYLCTDKPDNYVDIPSYGDGTHGRDLGPNIAETFQMRNNIRHTFKIAAGQAEEMASEEYKSAEALTTEGANRADVMTELFRLKRYNGQSDTEFRKLMLKRYQKSAADMTLDELLHCLRAESGRSDFQSGLDYVDTIFEMRASRAEKETADVV